MKSPPSSGAFVLFAIVLTVPWAAIFVRASDAHPLTLAFGRLVVSGAAFWAWSLRSRAPRVSSRSLLLISGAGLALAFHFITWITAVHYTSVASATSLGASTALWSALISIPLLGERARFVSWLGIIAATVGIATIGGVDLGTSRALRGDALGLAAGVLAAVYFTLGRAVRGALPLSRYMAILSFVAAAAVGAVALAWGVPLIPRGWAQLGAIAGLGLGSSVVNHGLCNLGVRMMRSYVVGLAILFEPVGSSLLIWLIAGEVAPAATYVGAAVIVAGVVLATIGERAGAVVP